HLAARESLAESTDSPAFSRTTMHDECTHARHEAFPAEPLGRVTCRHQQLSVRYKRTSCTPARRVARARRTSVPFLVNTTTTSPALVYAAGDRPATNATRQAEITE